MSHGLSRLQADGARIAGARLEDRPGEAIVVVLELFRVTRLITTEASRQTKDIEIWLLERGAGAPNDPDERAVAGVNARALLYPFLHVGVRGGIGRSERGLVDESKVASETGDHSDFVAILQVRADARKIDDRLDAELAPVEHAAQRRRA